MHKKLLIVILISLTLGVTAQTRKTVVNQPLLTATKQLAWWFKYWTPTDAKAPLVSLIIQRRACGIADAEVYLETVATDLNSRNIVFQALYDFTQGNRDYLFLNLKNIGLTAVNAQVITDFIINSHQENKNQGPILSEKQQTQKNIADNKKRKIELLNEYNKANEEIINGIEPLKQYHVNLNDNNEDYGLPKTIQYNQRELKYDIDKALLFNLLDSLNIGNEFYLRFDKTGKFKCLLNRDYKLINLTNSIFVSFQKSISLTTPIVLLYNQKKYTVDFETKQFYLHKSVDVVYKQFSFSPNKKSIDFLDTSYINATFKKDQSFKQSATAKESDDFYSKSYNINKVALSNSQESVDLLKEALYPIVSKIDYDNGYDDMVSSAKFLFYRYHFKIKKGILQYSAPGVIYIVNIKSPILIISLLEDVNGKTEQIATKVKNENGTKEINKIYVYNWITKRIEQLHR